MSNKSVFKEFNKEPTDVVKVTGESYRDVAIVFDNERGRRVLQLLKDEIHKGQMATENPYETTIRAAQRDMIDTINRWIMAGRMLLQEDSDHAKD